MIKLSFQHDAYFASPLTQSAVQGLRSVSSSFDPVAGPCVIDPRFVNEFIDRANDAEIKVSLLDPGAELARL